MKGLVVGALVALAASAHADNSGAEWQAAKQLFADAQQADDVAKYRACARAYAGVHAKLPPRSPDAPSMLFSAAVCHERGQEAKLALALYDRLAKLPPTEPVVQARFRAAQIVAAMGKLDDAARRFEAHAAAYAKLPATVTKDATAEIALYNAAQMWLVHGDDAKAIATAERYAKTYAASPDAVKLARSIAPAYERRGPAAHVAYLQGVVRRFGGKLGAHEVDVRLELGEALWKRSCAVPGQDGLCVKVERARAISTGPQLHCRGAKQLRVVRVKRDARLVREAQAELDRVVKLGEAKGDAHRQVARAKLALVDAKLEDYLALTFPTGLDFDPAKPGASKASTKKFQDWLATKTKLGAEARDRYTALLAANQQPEIGVAAIARAGQLVESMAIDLATAEIPRDVRSGQFSADKIAAFCDKLVEVSEPLIAQAKTAFETCLAKASQWAVHDRYSQICERELAHLDPQAPSATSEMVPLPRVAVPFALAGPPPAMANHPAELTAALAAYRTAAAHGVWTVASCKDTAAKFSAIASKHSSNDAHYMAGLALQQCNLHADALKAYRLILGKGVQEAAMINAGVAVHRLGDARAAEHAFVSWKSMIAHTNHAAIQLDKLRYEPTDASANTRARTFLDEVLAFDAFDDTAQLLRAAHGLVTWTPKMRLAAIEDALSRAQPKRVESLLAWAVLEARRDAWPRVDRATADALAMAPDLDDVQAARGLALLRVRRWTEAADHLAKVKVPSYEVLVGKAIALRGLGKTAEADAGYVKAIAMKDTRVEAHYNLGVLHAEHVAARAKDAAVIRPALQKASAAFRKAATLAPTSDAKRRADECDKLLAALKP